MTLAERLMELDPLTIMLSSEGDEKSQDKYVAEFKPGLANPLQIMDKYFDGGDPYTGNAIFLSYESAVELAKFLKHLFLDEDPEK